MFDDKKLNELREKYREELRKKDALTKDINAKIRTISKEFYDEETKQRDWEKSQKNKNKPSYMNLIFKWDNGIEFDTRKTYMNQFKDYVFNYGLPTSFEVRG